MANIALNKYADASNAVFPYQPAKAVDGVLTPLNRWVGSSPLPPGPVWLRIDLGAFYWINRWVVRHMGAVGWSPNYNLSDYKLQGSLDNANWFDIDTVINNTANKTDRPFVPRKVRWARLYVTKGLQCNTNFASVVDLEIYDAENAPFLSGLTISNGTLSPAFSGNIFSYTASVENSIGQITVTPTALNSSSIIKVNGQVVQSGHQSQSINLTVGSNNINIEVSSQDGVMKENYTIVVTRMGLQAYLTSLVLKDDMGDPISINPSFNKDTFSYGAGVPYGIPSVIVTPTAELPTSTIKVNNISVSSGMDSPPIALIVGPNTITVEVTATSGGIGTYTITVTRANS